MPTSTATLGGTQVERYEWNNVNFQLLEYAIAKSENSIYLPKRYYVKPLNDQVIEVVTLIWAESIYR